MFVDNIANKFRKSLVTSDNIMVNTKLSHQTVTYKFDIMYVHVICNIGYYQTITLILLLQVILKCSF